MHIATIVGTRPEIIKLSQVMKQLDKHYKQTLIHTGQNFDYELNEIFFKDLEFESQTTIWMLLEPIWVKA